MRGWKWGLPFWLMGASCLGVSAYWAFVDAKTWPDGTQDIAYDYAAMLALLGVVTILKGLHWASR